MRKTPPSERPDQSHTSGHRTSKRPHGSSGPRESGIINPDTVERQVGQFTGRGTPSLEKK